MPLKWFECPDGGRIEITDCLTEGGCRMSQRCAARPYLRLSASDRPWTGKPSTTMLIQGTMLAKLKIENDYAASPDDRAFMTHGTQVHSRLQMFDDNCCMQEIPLDGGDTGITGIPDVLQIEDGKSVLIDYKTSGSFKAAKAIGIKVDHIPTGVLYKSGPRKGISRTRKVMRQEVSEVDRWEWVLQLNWYRMLIEARSFPVDEMRVQCIVRDGGTHIAHSRGVFRNIYFFEIPRIPDDRILTYFQKKKADLLYALEHGWDDPCTATENWGGIRCQRYCDVAQFCPLGKYLRQERERRTISMPIKGLTEKNKMPVLGNVALGEMATNENGKTYPTELDYFKLRPKTADEEYAQHLIEQFQGLFGEEPKRIEVAFPVGKEEIIFPQWRMRWGRGSGLQCKGDGETATCMNKEFTKDLEVIGEDENGLIQVRCDGETCPYTEASKCSKQATLNVLIPKLEGLGVWLIRTGSRVSIENLNGCIRFIQLSAGRVHMIPLWLERRPQDITHTDKNGKQTKRTHHVLHLSMAINMEQLQKRALNESLILESQAALPAAEDEPVVVYDMDAGTGDMETTGELDFMSAVKMMAAKLDVAIETFGKFTKEQWGKQETALPILAAALTNDDKFGDLETLFADWHKAYVDQQAEAATEENSGW